MKKKVVIAPVDACGAHSGLFGPGRDLMGVKIVQVEPIDQRLLNR
jgi:hypothetical protein